MSAWDNWGGGFGSTVSDTGSEPNAEAQADSPFEQTTVEPEPVEMDSATTVNDSGPTGEPETDGDTEAAAGDTETDDAVKPKESKHKPKESKPSNKVPHLNDKVAEKLIGMIDTLRGDDHAVEAAKLMTGSRRNDVASLVAELTDGRNRLRIKEFADIAHQLSDVDESSLKAALIMVFASGKNNVENVFALLNAVAPDNGFGRVGKPSQDKWMQYAQTICDHWDERVDLTMVDRLQA